MYQHFERADGEKQLSVCPQFHALSFRKNRVSNVSSMCQIKRVVVAISADPVEDLTTFISGKNELGVCTRGGLFHMPEKYPHRLSGIRILNSKELPMAFRRNLVVARRKHRVVYHKISGHIS